MSEKKKNELVVTEDDMVKAFDEIEKLAKSQKDTPEKEPKEEKEALEKAEKEKAEKEALAKAEKAEKEALEKAEKEKAEKEKLAKSENAVEDNSEEETTEDDSNSDSEDTVEEDEAENTEEDGEDFASEANEDEVIQKSVEVSDFLESLVNQIGESIDPLTKALIKSHGKTEKRYEDIATMVGNLSTVVKGLAQELGAIKNSPVRLNKSQTTDAKPLEKTFEPDATGEKINKAAMGDFTPAKIADGMFELMKKGECDPLEITRFETDGTIRPELLEKIKKGF